MYRGIIIANRQFEVRKEFTTSAEYWAFDEGLTTGARLFAGTCGLYCEDHLEELHDDPRGAIIQEHLEWLKNGSQ